jgi:hypothetical protein
MMDRAELDEDDGWPQPSSKPLEVDFTPELDKTPAKSID